MINIINYSTSNPFQSLSVYLPHPLLPTETHYKIMFWIGFTALRKATLNFLCICILNFKKGASNPSFCFPIFYFSSSSLDWQSLDCGLWMQYPSTQWRLPRLDFSQNPPYGNPVKLQFCTWNQFQTHFSINFHLSSLPPFI